MGVDVLHLIGVDSGVFQRAAHAACGAGTVVRRRGHVKRIGTHAETDDLGVDRRTSRLGMLEFLEDQCTGTVGEHEAIPITVPRATGCGRIVVARG